MYEISFKLNTPYTDLHKLHGAVKRLLSEFQGQARGYQYRAFCVEGKTLVRARSQRKINEASIPWHKIDHSFDVGETVKVNLLANVVAQMEDGKKQALFGEKAENFFRRHLENAGLCIEELNLSKPYYNLVHKPSSKKPIKVHSQEALAIGKIEDVERLVSALSNGLGRSKHLGYGMLVIERLS